MKDSKITWTHHTFNPWIGCSKVSQGCAHCYAENLMDTRGGKVRWGVDGTRMRTGQKNWNDPVRWDKAAAKAGTRYRVFCASLADVFEPDVGGRWGLDSWRVELFDLIRRTPRLDWMLLTKRPAKWASILSSARIAAEGHRSLYEVKMWMTEWACGSPRDNVWMGATVEDQDSADSRIADLVRIPARVHFLSCEPLLGKVNLTGNLDGIDWVICGGESGGNARPMHPEWAASMRNQCRKAGVPFHFKQWGEWLPQGQVMLDQGASNAKRDSHVFPDGAMSVRVGKVAASRLLDGVEWDMYPGDAHAKTT